MKDDYKRWLEKAETTNQRLRDALKRECHCEKPYRQACSACASLQAIKEGSE